MFKENSIKLGFLIAFAILIVIVQSNAGGYKVSKEPEKRYLYYSINNKPMKYQLLSNSSTFGFKCSEGDEITFSLHENQNSSEQWSIVSENPSFDYLESKVVRKKKLSTKTIDGNDTSRRIIKLKAVEQGKTIVVLKCGEFEIRTNISVE